ncbi:MAG: DUF1015 domain-containing protein [Bacteroidota bacterium]
MPQIIPFRGYRYNQSSVAMEDVIAPPYDVISPEQQTRLYDRSPYNVVRLILGREADRYSSAAKFFEDWQKDHILVREEKPALYVLHQSFEDQTGSLTTRKGFIALCRLEDFEKNVVLPHEKTLAKPREDRFALFKATRSNFSQVFSLYWDPENEVDEHLNGFAKSNPEIDVTFENVQNRMWMLQETGIIRKVQQFLSDKQVLIADGHHRYETALAYRDFVKARNPKVPGNDLSNYVMMYFTNIEDRGLVIYPTHRIVHSLPNFDGAKFLEEVGRFFIVREFKDRDSLQTGLQSSAVRSFGVVIQGDPKFYLLTLKPTSQAGEVVADSMPDEVKELDVTLLHTVILRDLLGISAQAQEQKLNLEYSKSVEESVESVRSGKGQISFLMNPTKIEEVRRVAKAGLTMPQKSTFFFPKLLSGLVINKMADEKKLP